MQILKNAQSLYSKYNFYTNLILSIASLYLGWKFIDVFYKTRLAVWLTDNVENTFIGDLLNPFPVIAEMLAKAFVPLFLAMGIAFFIYHYYKESGVNKVSWALSFLAKGSIKVVQIFTGTLIGGCAYINYNWDKVYPHHKIFEAQDVKGFKIVLVLLILFWLVCWLMKFAAKINFKELGDKPKRIEKWLKEFSDKNSKKIAYSCLGFSLFVAISLPIYELYNKITLVQEACAKATKVTCDLPNFSELF